MNKILYPKSKQKIKTIFIAQILLIILFLGFLSLGIINKNSNKILKGVQIDAINIGNMTKEEAEKVISDQQQNIGSKQFLLSFGNREINVSGDGIELKFVDDLVVKAYEHGRNGNIIENSLVAWKSLLGDTFSIKSEYILNDDKLNENIKVLLEEEKDTVLDDTYEISGDKILVSKGHDGVVANYDSIKQSILDNTGSADSEIKLVIDTNIVEAKRINFNRVYKEIFIEKKDASYTQKSDGTVDYAEEIIGLSFDIENAETMYKNLKNDETMTVNLIKDVPKITTDNLDDVLFADVLATYKTEYNASNKDRSTNLEVAARNINGTIILPGEEFSYNKEVGQRTYENGFKDAHIFSGGKVVDGLGGGICQVSSTLYNAVLMADLEVTERKNHMLYPEYVKPSLDATVVWGSIDFRFKNNRQTPIKIEAIVRNGIATTTIYGKKLKDDPIIEIESVIEKTVPYTTVTEYDDTMDEGKSVVTQDPVNGYVSKAYRIEKDETGKEVSRTLISSDTYRQTSKIITVGTKKVVVVQPIEPEVTEPSEDTNQNNGQEIAPEDNSSSEWPTGWESPENPYYTGNY